MKGYVYQHPARKQKELGTNANKFRDSLLVQSLSPDFWIFNNEDWCDAMV
jgi:hypothetical protein